MTIVRKESQVGGVPRGAFPWWVLNQDLSKKILLVIPEEEDVLDVVDDLQALFRLPKKWNGPKSFAVSGYVEDDEPARQVALHGWLSGKMRCLVLSPSGLKLACDSGKKLIEKTFQVRPGLIMKRPDFEEVLGQGSYSRTDRVEQVGEYSIRGDVTDVWPPSQSMPVRITWNFDTVEAIRDIDIYSQRSEEYLREVVLHPVLSGSGATVVDLIPDQTQIFVLSSDPHPKNLASFLEKHPAQVVGPFDAPSQSQGFQPPPRFSGHIEQLKKQLIQWHEEDWRLVIYCHNQGERDRLEELLEDPIYGAKGQKAPWCPDMIIGELEHGFLNESFRFGVLANSEIFGRYRKRVRLPKFSGGQSLSSVFEININDFLVHERHGIGRYRGLTSLTVNKVTSEFLSLEYKGGDKLYVPIFELQQVQKYMGAEGRRPALSSLDTAKWERLKSKVKEDVVKLATELLAQAAKRNVRPGYAFPPRNHMEQEFADSFLYNLTADQEKALQEVENDMVNAKAMDRLICGDVGYGKTEVAMRAALKCALAGKQVGLLCPTTILAEQHYRNFKERMADYPVTIALLSRFQTKGEQKVIIEQIKSGGDDIVIGTHRLLSKDVGFKNLGLLIIDEEHRFGVKQKNKILGIRDTVDVLSLTATPIPRTLATSLGGIKNLSIIETPPEGRLPIGTHVGIFDEDLMVKAVQEELDRDGQVFYVHNRVKTLLSRKKWLEDLLPHIRIGMVHGQMKEDEIESVMFDFLHKKINLLLATTIIESGLDIPSVNTLIVEEAEEMGLAQLYQLRGRVGRSTRRAFCYLFYSTSGMTTDAKKRLEALKEHTALGSGFRLAMRDMEIRGAGNLLGSQQHGNMAAVGLETFSRLLEEEIIKLKGEEAREEEKPIVMELNLASYIPDDYMPAESERIQMYKRILNAPLDHLGKLKEELKDRCGPLPEPAQTLFDAASYRLALKKRGIVEVHQETGSVLVYFKPNFQLSDTAFGVIMKHKGEQLDLIPGEPPGIRIHLQKEEKILDALRRFLQLIFPN